MPKRVLVVEDSPTQAEVLRDSLARAGYDAAVATSGEAGLERFEREPFDVVVSDIVMPGAIDGYELCRRIKAGGHRDTPVVLLTSLADPLDIIGGLECGADNFFTKPYDPQHLLDRLHVLLTTREARAREQGASRISVGVKIFFMGRQFTVTSEREQILDLLVTTFEEAVRQNRELRQREAELTEAQSKLARYARTLEARLESILSSVPDVLFSVTADGAEVRYISPAVTRVFGCEPEEFTLEYWRERVHPEDRERAWGAFRAVVETRTAQAVEYRFLPRPGETRWILEHFVPAANGVPRVDGIARDVTELKEREATFRLMFANNPLPMWLYDRNTLQFLEVNDRAVQHYGYTREEFLAMRLTDVRPESEVPRLLENLAEHRDRIDVSGIWSHRKKNGEVIEVRIVSHTMRFAGRDAALVVAEDVTERRRLEQQLRQAQKMEAVGRLAGGVAHDFNNVLTAIFAETDMALSDLPEGSALREPIEEIRKNAERAATLTRQLLTFSRRQVVQPTVLSLNDVVGDAEKMLMRLIGEDVELRARLAPDLGATTADRGQLEQVLVNLVINARDAMPGGGSLGIETANVALDEEYVRTHAETVPGDYVVLAVSDTGTGMTPEVIAHIFEPFFTTKEADKGTGLGLATCYGIVKQCGGHINVYSEPGVGTTFRIYLPRAARGEAAGPRSQGDLPRGSETLLVVEDAQPVRRAAVRILHGLGYQVLEAGDGVEALAILRRPDVAIHLLVTDVVMPRMSGRELAEHARRSRPGLRVLYSSGYTSDVITQQQLLEEGVAFLQKPYVLEELARKVREVLDAPGPTAR